MPDTLQYMVILEQGSDSYGAYVPDLPGCVAAGATREEALELIRDAIMLHIEALQEQGEVIPEPRSSVETIHITAA
jgi:predicted RNase H-like HicB family nuclease